MNKSKIVLKFEKFLNNLTYFYKLSLLGWIKKENNHIFFNWYITLTIFLFNFAPKELIAPR